MGPGQRSAFRGTERFVVKHLLGVGGMGAVYRADDRAHASQVALKVLTNLDPQAVYRFKHEFRSLARVSHPNLVTLYDLVSHGDDWFFTMEYIAGIDLLAYVRGGPAAPAERDTTVALAARAPPPSTLATQTGSGAARQPTARSTAPPLATSAQLERLRGVLGQLSAGLSALHGAGFLHRDVKPSNVLVTPDGRVVLLDFGIVTDVDATRPDLDQGNAVGTPAYMAPEQLSAEPLTEAADWYAVGVLLYEALTGRRPFSGERVLEDKASQDPAPPQLVVPDASRELSELCMRLLVRDPSRRATGADVAAVVGVAPDARATSAPRGVLIGRERHLAALRRAFAESRAGALRVAVLRGRSGMGKTTLCNAFLDEARAFGAVTLSGRCYERESVPYKALDGMIDALYRHLLELQRRRMCPLMPEAAGALGRLFPVMSRIRTAMGARRGDDGPKDPHELRRRGIAGLRELLAEIALHQPIVIAVDDIQWGDTDSAELFAELLAPPEPPPMLVIANVRAETAADSPFGTNYWDRIGRFAGDDVLMTIAVARLAVSDAQRLAESLLDGATDAPSRAAEIARESGGNPFFVTALSKYGAADGEPVTLKNAVAAMIEGLPDAARRLLETVAIAGGPVSDRVALMAADVGDDGAPAVVTLRNHNLLRSHGAAGALLETYHDRIREAAAANAAGESRRATHGRLARALEQYGEGDAHTLAAHYDAAGERQVARAHYVAAARAAADALAFERAAHLYARALEFHDGEVPPGLRLDYAEAVARSGRSADSAPLYLAAMDGADEATRLECQRRAAEMWLGSGHVEQGLAAFDALLRYSGAHLPKTPRRAIASLLWHRAALRLRGLDFEPRDVAEVPPEDLLRIETLKAVTCGLGMVDAIRVMSFQTQSLRAALDAGEPVRVCRALGLEAVFFGGLGIRTRTRVHELLTRADDIVARFDDDYARAWALSSRGAVHFMYGEFPDAVAPIEESLGLFAASDWDTTWERGTIGSYRLFAMIAAGELARSAALRRDMLRDAVARGDRYIETLLRLDVGLLWLVEAGPARARDELALAEERVAEAGFVMQELSTARMAAEIALYDGDPNAALTAARRGIAAMRRAGLGRIQYMRAELGWLLARAHLARGDATAARRRARKLAREDVRYATAYAALLRAGAAAVAGDDDGAVRQLRAALSAAGGYIAGVHACAARRLGERLGGDEGAALIAAATRYFEHEGVAEPDRLVELFTPGLSP